MAVRTWVGRFCVDGGRVEEEGAWLGSLIRQRPDDDPDELYVLIEPAAAGSEQYTSQLVDVIAQLYAKDPLSLTGALTRSLRAAHEHLRDWNRKSLPEHRVGAGASCLALRGTDAYLAQAGPSLAYVLTAAGDFRRVEADQPIFDEALGVAERFEPGLLRLKLEPGDLVLLASSRLDAIAPADHVRRILERGADDALPEFYLLTKDEPQMSLVLLSCFEEETAVVPPFLTRDGDSLDSGDAGAEIAVEKPLADAAGVAVASPALAGESADAPSASLARAMEGGFGLTPRPIREQVREITRDTAPPPAANVRIRGDAATPRYKRSTGSLPIPQFQIPKLAVFAALAVALVAALIWWQLPGSVQESREDRFVALLADARSANAQAQATADKGTKRTLLTEAQTKLDAAAKIHKDNGEMLALRADVSAGIDSLNAVKEVKSLATVSDLTQEVTGSLSVTRTATGGDSAYLLDAKGGRVLRVHLDGETAPETVLQEGVLGGVIAAGRPLQISWAAGLTTPGLIIVDDRRQAFAYFPDADALPLSVRGAADLGSVDAITTAGRNLYVLDVEGAQVWRYLPGQGGFDSERTALLDGANLENATELAVGQDVYVLDSKLGIRRFVGKAEASFPLAGIDRPLMSPASLSVLPGSNRVIVADRANKRIVVASAEGAFLQQIVSPSFTDLRAVSVDEGTNTLYVLNGDTLLSAPFPP
jgi:hypothetical protein